jgi:hypothetical protein
MTSRIIICLLISLAAPLLSAPRDWKSEDGTRNIRGEFIKRDASTVTIRRGLDHKDITIPMDKLHPADLAWVNANHPLQSQPAGQDMPDDSAVFDKLSYGESRAEVLAKLKTSTFVELGVPETFIGRTGLNDVFRTRRKIGGLDASLFFDWTEDGKLKEITLQSSALPASALKDQLAPCWKEMAELLTTLYGKPLQADSELRISSIQDGTMVPSHLWNLEKNGSAMLGASRDGQKYQIVARFTRKPVVSFAIPGSIP